MRRLLLPSLSMIFLLCAAPLNADSESEPRQQRVYPADHPDLYDPPGSFPVDRPLMQFSVMEREGEEYEQISLSKLPEGSKSIRIQAIDEATSTPLTAYALHARLVELYNYYYYAGMAEDRIIGRLESQHIKNPEGFAAYTNLPDNPTMRYQVQVVAPGYIPQHQETRIPGREQTLRFDMERASSFKVRFVDGATSQPLRDAQVHIEYNVDESDADPFNGEEFYRPASEHLGSRGEYESGPIPPQTCKIDLPEFNEVPFRPAGQSLDPTRPHFCNPYWRIDLSKPGVTDLGTLVLERVPIADIQIVGPKGQPLRHFSFGMYFDEYNKYSKEEQGYRDYYYRSDLRTDANGRCTVPLIGYIRGQKVHVFAPGNRNDVNEVAVQPTPGTVVPITLIYLPQRDDLNLQLTFRDKATQAIIPNIRGKIICNDTANSRAFETSTGRVEIPCFPLNQATLDAEKSYAEKSLFTPNDPQLPSLKHLLQIQVGLEAPGYPQQQFTIPLEEARMGREIVLQLGPATLVKGRILIAPGVPLNAATLAQAHQQLPAEERRYRYLPSTISAYFENTTSWKDTDPRATQSPLRGNAPLDANGCFITIQLKPARDWSLTISTGVLPAFVKKNIEIKPGLNDLGDILMNEAGH